MTALVEQAAAHWKFVSPLVTKPKSEADYDRLVAMLDEVLAIYGGDGDHELAGLASVMGDLITAYDEEHRPMPPIDGVEALRYLMREHGIAEDGLPELGSAETVSAILHGTRAIDGRQARDLSTRLSLPADLFLPA